MSLLFALFVLPNKSSTMSHNGQLTNWLQVAVGAAAAVLAVGTVLVKLCICVIRTSSLIPSLHLSNH